MTEVGIIRGTTYLPELHSTVRSTGLPFDFSGYTCYWALKAQADETAVYAVDPISGTAANGKLHGVTVDTAAIEPGVYTAEWQWTINTTVKKYQYILNISPRVILP